MTRRVLEKVGLWRQRTLVFGSKTAIERAVRVMSADRSMGYSIVGSLSAHECRRLTSPESWHAMMVARGADCIAVSADSGGEPDADVLASLNMTGIPLALIPSFSSVPVVGCQPQYVHGHDTMLMTWQPRLMEPLARLAKIVMDYVIAGVLCALLLPLFLVITILVRADGGPTLFRHRRIGVGGKCFMCLKFRSMKVNADEILTALLESDPAAAREWALNRKLTNDPRITPIGRFLRLTSLDELPQLWNVLRGEMSLVGPRPIVQSEAEFYGRWIGYYTHMKPGVTGLWQASGRSKTSYDQRVQLDVWYARNWSLWQDIAILLMTIPAVLLRKGAM